jgi:hypothetical protein
VYRKDRVRVYRLLSRETKLTTKRMPLWQQWGYDYALVALVKAKYRTEVRAFRVYNFRPGRARIALYMFRSWRPADERQDTSIILLAIENMRWRKGHWLFVRESKARHAPNLVGSQELSFKELDNLYAPYLKGFTKYEYNPAKSG